MSNKRFGVIGLAVVAWAGPIWAEEVSFSDDFDRADFGDSWKGHADSFALKDGVLVAAQKPDANHGAVTRAQLDFRDAVIEFDFMFDGGTSFNFVVDDKDCKEVHAGHIIRVSVRKNKLMLQDDYTGVMNLALRKLAEDPAKKDYVDSVKAACRLDVDVDFKEKSWHRMKIGIAGDLLTVSVDGKPVGELRSKGIAHPTKTQFGFTVNGRSVHYDNVTAVGSK